jgi:hypothetical protein
VVNQRAFGRRVGQQLPKKKRVAQIDDRRPADEPSDTPPPFPMDASDEDDLLEWKSKRSFRWPWRQILFTASLCFGMASFVLPDSVNDDAQWLLYALAATSFCAGLARRRQAQG